MIYKYSDQNILYVSFYNQELAQITIMSNDSKSASRLNAFINSHFKFYNEKATHSYEYQDGHFTDPYIEFYNKDNGTLAYGLLNKFKNFIKDNYPQYIIKIDDQVRKVFTAPRKVVRSDLEDFCKTLDIHNSITKNKLTPFDHQYNIIESALNTRRVSIQACTSAGKSLSLYVLARWLMKHEFGSYGKVLLVVPSSALVVQLFRDFYEEYGWATAKDNCTLVYGDSDDKLKPNELQFLKNIGLGEEATLKNVVIGTWQSIQNKSEEYLSKFTHVIVDEAHTTRGVNLREILKKCVNATNFKVGLSGTLPTEGIDSAYIESQLGKRDVVIQLKTLIALGILTPIEVRAIKIPYNNEYRSLITNKDYKTEYSLITSNGSRKDVISMLIEAGQINTDQNTVILFRSLDHLYTVHEYLKERFPEFTYHTVDGEVNTDIRDDIRTQIETCTGHILLASYGTMKQGVNIKLLHNLVFADFSKSFYEVVQSIGRIVRRHISKTKAIVYDLYDDCSYLPNSRSGFPIMKLNYSYRHHNTRRFYYDEEDIPIIEYDLTGIYEASINVEVYNKLKEKSKKRKEAKKKKLEESIKKQTNKKKIIEASLDNSLATNIKKNKLTKCIEDFL